MAVVKLLRPLVWLVFWATLIFALFAPEPRLDRILALIFGGVGIAILAVAEIDELLITHRSTKSHHHPV